MVLMDSATLQNMIISTWRSGSTFVGEAVASHPETYYHFEPLNQFRIVQVHTRVLNCSTIYVFSDNMHLIEMSLCRRVQESHLHKKRHNS